MREEQTKTRAQCMCLLIKCLRRKWVQHGSCPKQTPSTLVTNLSQCLNMCLILSMWEFPLSSMGLRICLKTRCANGTLLNWGLKEQYTDKVRSAVRWIRIWIPSSLRTINKAKQRVYDLSGSTVCQWCPLSTFQYSLAVGNLCYILGHSPSVGTGSMDPVLIQSWLQSHIHESDYGTFSSQGARTLSSAWQVMCHILHFFKS